MKARLHLLRPRVQSLGSRLQPKATHGSAGIRWTGRKAVEWRARILAAEPLCRHCRAKGIVRLAEEVDHVIPLEQGGTYATENACPLCVPCHRIKTAKDRGYRQRQAFDVDGNPVE